MSPIFFLRWTREPLIDDVRLLRYRLREAAHEVGDDLVYIAIIPVGVTTPSTEVRKALTEGSMEARRLCAAMHLVIEGSGPRRTLMRAAVGGILLDGVQNLLHRKMGPSLFRTGTSVNSSLREALTEAAQKVTFDVEKILLEARERGMCEQ